jgi:hypothetical protein
LIVYIYTSEFTVLTKPFGVQRVRESCACSVERYDR